MPICKCGAKREPKAQALNEGWKSFISSKRIGSHWVCPNCLKLEAITEDTRLNMNRPDPRSSD